MRVGVEHGDDGIAEDHKIRARTQTVKGICRVRIAGREMRSERRGQVAAGGESHDADAVRRDTEFFRARTDDAEGALDVFELRGIVIARAEAILQHEGRHAQRVQPVSDLGALLVNRQVNVSAAGTYDNACADRLGRLRQIYGERGFVLGKRADRTRCAVRPDKLHRRRLLGKAGESNETHCQQQESSHDRNLQYGFAALRGKRLYLNVEK